MRCSDSYQSDEIDPLAHCYGLCSSNGNDTHSAMCKRGGCGYMGMTDCQWFTRQLPAEGEEKPYEFVLCPVCGDVKDEVGNGAHLAAEERAVAKALTQCLPAGELILRIGTLENGETIMSVGFELAGKLTRPTGQVAFTLPAECLDGYALMLLEEDGTQTPLSFTVADGKATFTLDFTAVDKAPCPPPCVCSTWFPLRKTMGAFRCNWQELTAKDLGSAECVGCKTQGLKSFPSKLIG